MFLWELPGPTCLFPPRTWVDSPNSQPSPAQLLRLKIAPAVLWCVLSSLPLPHSLHSWWMRHCFSSSQEFLQVTLGTHLTASFKTHTAHYSIWNIFRGVQGSLTCKPRIHWCTYKQMQACTHTDTDLWAMRFTLPTHYSTLIHQKPLSPHTVWDGDCIVTQRRGHSERNRKRERKREEWGGGRGAAGCSSWCTIKEESLAGHCRWCMYRCRCMEMNTSMNYPLKLASSNLVFNTTEFT